MRIAGAKPKKLLPKKLPVARFRLAGQVKVPDEAQGRRN